MKLRNAFTHLLLICLLVILIYTGWSNQYIKWDRHFSTEFLYNKGSAGLGSVGTLDGTIINLKHEALEIDISFSL